MAIAATTTERRALRIVSPAIVPQVFDLLGLLHRRHRARPNDVGVGPGRDDRSADVLGGDSALHLRPRRVIQEPDGELGATCEVDAERKAAVDHEVDAGDDDQQREEEVPVAAADEVDLSYAWRSENCLDSGRHHRLQLGGGWLSGLELFLLYVFVFVLWRFGLQHPGLRVLRLIGHDPPPSAPGAGSGCRP